MNTLILYVVRANNPSGELHGANLGGIRVDNKNFNVVLSAPLINSCRHRINRGRKPKRANSNIKVGTVLLAVVLFLATPVLGTYENLDFNNW